MSPMKPLTALLIAALAILLTACTLRPPQSGEERMIDSVALSPELSQGVVATPFCLHLRYSNKFFVIYSDTHSEAWVTDGTCATNGARRSVEGLRLSWWNDWHHAHEHRQCDGVDTCRVSAQNVVEGQNIRCASAQARDRNQTAFITTDQTVCH